MIPRLITTMARPTKRLTAAALLLLLTLPAAAAPPSAGYTMTDLGELITAYTGEGNGAFGVNDAGQVILNGMTTPSPQTGNAVLWDTGRETDLGTLPPLTVEDGTHSEAYGLNNRGQVVGSAGSFGPIFMSGLQFSRGFLYKGGVLHQLTDKAASFQPFAINDAGQIAGRNAHRGFFYVRGKLTPIATLSHVPAGNASTARALNAAGLVAGWSTVGGKENGPILPFHAFLWDAKTRKLHDLGTLPGHRNSYAYSINERGQAVGLAANEPPTTFGFFGASVTAKEAIGMLWAGKTKTPLPPLPGDVSSAAWGINNAGVIVGQSVDAKGTVHACLWRDKKAVDLNTLMHVGSQWTLTRVSAISNKGWIVGSGTLNGKPHAFLLTPR